MTEIFRTKEVGEVGEVTERQSEPLKDLVNEEVGNAKPLRDEATEDERNLVVWEGLNRSRFVDNYFNTKNISHEFIVKMPTSEIDKFVKSEISERGYDPTVDNYEKVLREIEEEIGSSNLELFGRFKKITGYIRAISRLRKAKQLKESYLARE